MNKPLTVEELKALCLGDWIWLKYGNIFTYVEKTFRGSPFDMDTDIFSCIMSGRYQELYYCDYGERWIAYKNKEQAENNQKQCKTT